MSDVISFVEFRAGMADALGRVRHGGARLVLTTHGTPVAAVVPIADLERLTDLGVPPAAGPPEVEVSVHVPTDAQAVWRAWFNTRQRLRWWPTVLLDPYVDGEVSERVLTGDGSVLVLSGRITAADRPRGFRFTWNELGQAPTRVEVSIQDVAEEELHEPGGPPGTVVTLVQTGWAPGDHGRADEQRERWATLLGELVRSLTPGAAGGAG